MVLNISKNLPKIYIRAFACPFLVVYIFLVCSPDLKLPSRYTNMFDKVNIWYSRIITLLKRTLVNSVPCLPRNAFYFFIP